jgi:diaminopropionate ammonia-lyase
MDLRRFPARHVRNASARREAPFGEAERRVLGLDAIRAARAEIETWPGYAPTPLRPLPGLAGRLGLGAVLYKDEGRRFGLGSFKALGGAYAVLRLLQRHLRDRHGVEAGAAELLAGRHRALAREVTVATATDGNHGRSVAWGAERFGARCVVYIHEGVSPAREEGIARYGAEVRRVPGGYDDSVRRCAADAAARGWRLVADTSADGGWEVPAMVMQGYGLLAEEALEQAAGRAPFTHVFVQAGVGGLAAAVAAVMWQRLGAGRPRIVVVEPERADCVFRTVAAGRPTPVPGEADTFMACLAAGEVSPAAWEILRTAADDVLALPDEAAGDAMRALADGVGGDRPVVAGESGCAAAAGLVAAALDPRLRERLDLGRESRILVIGSEGATDALTYERTVGRTAEAVEAA